MFMAEKGSEAQADKKSVEETTAEVADKTVKEAAEVPAGATAASTEADVPESPFGDYDDKTIAQLKSHAKSRGVEINRDVERAEYIKLLRASEGVEQDPGEYPDNLKYSYDVKPLEEIRDLAKKAGVELSEEFVRAHLVTELRAADTSGGTDKK
jgi:hypothetical protein